MMKTKAIIIMNKKQNFYPHNKRVFQDMSPLLKMRFRILEFGTQLLPEKLFKIQVFIHSLKENFMLPLNNI